ncbi:hypothetical protein B0A48_00940 [Cryoendolithus antarcticus]|uniref:Exonuclease domain-containing protein n=1 Tax=Cryoendolithus antarcticus TaxID=1507870 RepID=A0A1V8TRY5_9PEZI|nr:hypothetical protein B0A48_00940 [Cryoendolithus antarcticus]
MPAFGCRATQLKPLWHLVIGKKVVYFDVEFQEWSTDGMKGHRHRLGRVSVVTEDGMVILDVFTFYDNEEGVNKHLPPPKKKLGVYRDDLKIKNGAVRASTVECWLKDIFDGRTVVMHSKTHDMDAFYLEKYIWARSKTVDTQKMLAGHPAVGCNKNPGLSTCATIMLGKNIQVVEHSSREDALTTAELYHQAVHVHNIDPALYTKDHSITPYYPWVFQDHIISSASSTVGSEDSKPTTPSSDASSAATSVTSLVITSTPPSKAPAPRLLGAWMKPLQLTTTP